MYHYFLTALLLALTASLTLAQPTPITIDNIHQLRQIAQYGMGAPLKFDISPDGTRFGVAMGQGGVRVYDTADLSTPLGVFTLRNGDARDVDFAPDNRIAVAYTGGEVVLYDGRTFTQQLVMDSHTSSAVAVDFSPDGSKVVSGGWDHTARVWDTSTGRELLTLTLDSRGSNVAFSPDGTKLAVVDRGGRLFDADTGASIVDLLTHTNIIYNLAFSPDSTTLATASNDKTIKLWDTTTGAEKTTIAGHDEALLWVLFHPEDPTHLLTGTAASSIYRWDITSGQRLSRIDTRSPLLNLARLPDGNWLGTSQEFGAVLFDAKFNDQTVQSDIRSKINTMALAPDGRIAVGYFSGEIELVDPMTGTSDILIAGDMKTLGGVRDLSYTPDESHLVVTYIRNLMHVYETTEYTRVAETKTSKTFNQIVIDAQSQRVATLGRLTTVYSLPDLTLLADLGYTVLTSTLAFSPDGSQIAVGSRDEGVTLFDGVTYTPQTVIAGPMKTEYTMPGVVTEARYTPAGAGVLVSWNHYTTALYDSTTGDLIRQVELDHDLAQYIVIAPDDSFIVFMDFREMIVMDWNSVQPVIKLEKTYQGNAVDGAFNPDATYLYTLTDESIIRVWAVK
jgi:WD40 repeat protein